MTTNFKWHMPICEEICRAEQKYMPFFGTITERDLRKKSKARKHVKIEPMLRSGFFPRKTRSVMVPRFGIFPGFADKG